jgi:hypothetical protein
VVGELWKLVQTRLSSDLIYLSADPIPSQHQSSLHARPGFVAPHSPAAHLHPTNRLLRGVIRPGHIRLPVENTIIVPMVTQADEQFAQFIHGRERSIRACSFNCYLLPKLKQALSTLRRQFGDQLFHFLDHPQPLLGQAFLQLIERPAYPAAQMELAYLLFDVQLLGCAS